MEWKNDPLKIPILNIGDADDLYLVSWISIAAQEQICLL
ncbi:hypothetical protein AM1_E0218 (plasmid) [Acaryochloris marina MBIC11017]|uniref:Uncharacterized protein n=1 Tax=Acaryochloris marina (strain MBIC 11017) TaxID=329726 RepID=A8ZPQ1_ACAM1|nr:hypothetical protein AM1_E0218 [Acaryochloris marina MBIC11017]